MKWTKHIERTNGMPTWANFIARDPDGTTCIYANEPDQQDDGSYMAYGEYAEVHWTDDIALPPRYAAHIR